MSGCGYDDTCPNCGSSVNAYTDWKPFSYTTLECNRCGLLIYPKVNYMSLEELNSAREQSNENGFGRKLRMLKRLPKQTFQF